MNIIDNVLWQSRKQQEYNEKIVHNLWHTESWKLATDHFNRDGVISDYYHKINDNLDSFSDTGMVFLSYKSNREEESKRYSYFNEFAELVWSAALLNLPVRFKKPKIDRIMWNYYNQSSTGHYHIDGTDSQYSMIYNLNTSDGGTYIEDEFVEGISGRAVVFRSDTPHRGKGPTTYKSRFAVNIVFNVED